MSQEEEHECGKEIQSNYFQTDYSLAISKNNEQVYDVQGYYDSEEDLSGEQDKSNKINITVHAVEGEDSVRPPLVGQASGEVSKGDAVEKVEPLMDQGLPSPASASSLVSVKPLEWDSGADVGYFQEEQPQISSIERLALNGSRLKRSDPEGTTGSIIVQQLGPPDAESTRVSSDSKESSEEHQRPLFPEVIVQNHEVSDSEAEKEDKPKEFSGSNTFPRMQSHRELHPRVREIAGVKSNSNSSVATVVKNQENIPNEKNQSETDSVQTSANSFEYVPGDKYENSNSSLNLEKDVEKAVQILSAFMKGSGANDTISKNQILKKVVSSIIQKSYPEDRDWEGEVFDGRCITRRGQNRYDISGQSTPREDSRDSVVSRMEKKAAEGHSGSSSSYKHITSTDQSDDSRPKAEGQVPPKIPPKKSSSSSSSKVKKIDLNKTSRNEDKVDWRGPITAAEKAYEIRKSKEKALDPKLLRYLSSERENQLEWIKKEINHLSNLKTLLEKHETIKRHFANLRHTKDKHPFETKYYQRRREAKSAPSRRPVDTEISSDQSSWHSHGYESKKKGLLKRNASTNTGMSIVTEMAKPVAKSVAYTIVFQETDKENNKEIDELKLKILDREKLKRESQERVKEQLSQLKIQEELMAKKPDYVLRAENRRQVVAELAALREIRNQNKHKILAAAMSDDIPHDLPPNPLAVRRVVSQKAMRNLTEKTYKKTTEIKQKQKEQKRKQDYQTNRLMADIFNKKLQRKVLRGQTDLSNSVNVISSV